MNTSRRGASRKAKNVSRESTQDISQFVRRKSREELVEIDDDDDEEVQELTDQVINIYKFKLVLIRTLSSALFCLRQ
jgi:hypothetical protein